jgi:type I restriction-modification system DNA methylase subunit
LRAESCAAAPIFAHKRSPYQTVDSELLFVDRYLKLLRPGGRVLAVVPDGVVSAAGAAFYMRQQLATRARLHAVIELPAETFAQAGTRTKTAIVYAEKKERGDDATDRVFFAEATDIGFRVAKRKGVPIKRAEGTNQLPEIAALYGCRA